MKEINIEILTTTIGTYISSCEKKGTYSLIIKSVSVPR